MIVWAIIRHVLFLKTFFYYQKQDKHFDFLKNIEHTKKQFFKEAAKSQKML